ncbi:hypothetical protein PHMEG_00025565, partial [Phytophthora megakarya]
LADIVRLRRGETPDDCRPYKGLNPTLLAQLLPCYAFVDLLVSIARQGILPVWTAANPTARRSPRNHKLAQQYLPAPLKSIRRGQVDGTYLIVDVKMLEHWDNIQCSPFGAVEKKGIDPHIEIRPIHDLSYPVETSTNDRFYTDCAPDIIYTGVMILASRIERAARDNPGTVIKLLKGDVKTAFRHLMVHAEHVRWLRATIPEGNTLVIDLAVPFGWSGSLVFYGAFGRAIKTLVSSNSPATIFDSEDEEPFFGFEWVDDHVLVEPDRADRLEIAEATLRLSLLAVLGPTSINDSKFSSWCTKLQVLGPIWNTTNLTVSMPRENVTKWLDRVMQILVCATVTKNQQLHTVCSRLKTARLSDASWRDLEWFRYILIYGHLKELPLHFFGALPCPDIHLNMDASNTGLAVLYPSTVKFIQLTFDAEEKLLIQDAETSGFTINVREHFRMALAALCWGEQVQIHFIMPHVVCWRDNATAVTWINSLQSKIHFHRNQPRHQYYSSCFQHSTVGAASPGFLESHG